MNCCNFYDKNQQNVPDLKHVKTQIIIKINNITHRAFFQTSHQENTSKTLLLYAILTLFQNVTNTALE